MCAKSIGRKNRPAKKDQLFFGFAGNLRPRARRRENLERILAVREAAVRAKYLQTPELAEFRLNEIRAQLGAISPGKRRSARAELLIRTAKILSKIALDYEARLQREGKRK